MRLLLLALLVAATACRRPSTQLKSMMTPAQPDGSDSELVSYTNHIRAGNDIVASGNEPFWSLTVNTSKNYMTFKTLNGDSLVVPRPQRTDETRGAFRYEATAGTTRLIARFRADSCIDNMSGQRLDYHVDVTANGKTYTGCGASLGQLMTLNDIWVLQTLNGRPITLGPNQKELPRLEINLSDGRVSGLAGCNRIMGPVRADTRRVVFGPLASTMMACPGETAQLETDFLKALDGPLGYQIGNMTLTLMRDGKPLATFRKVD